LASKTPPPRYLGGYASCDDLQLTTGICPRPSHPFRQLENGFTNAREMR